jgi:hypothetical protein
MAEEIVRSLDPIAIGLGDDPENKKDFKGFGVFLRTSVLGLRT